jgi:hypothetical protein
MVTYPASDGGYITAIDQQPGMYEKMGGHDGRGT